MGDRKRSLSDRLKMLANLVTPGNRVADIGCDHGYLSIYLVENGIAPSAIAMDVRRGPLAAARAHIAEAGLESSIETRLSDGLEKLEMGEADAIICAGMGGKLMQRILTEGMERAREAKELILQPQSEMAEFRAFLQENGFRTIAEDACLEDGKYYFCMKAVWCACPEESENAYDASEISKRLADAYGEGLLKMRHPVLQSYLATRKRILTEVSEKMKASETEQNKMRHAEREREIREELSAIKEALALWEK